MLCYSVSNPISTDSLLPLPFNIQNWRNIFNEKTRSCCYLRIVTHHSEKFVPRAANNPIKLKLTSYALVRASPPIIGISDSNTAQLVFSPVKKLIKIEQRKRQNSSHEKTDM